MADCKTLEQMRAPGRYDRYVPSIEQTGTFQYKLILERPEEEKTKKYKLSFYHAEIVCQRLIMKAQASRSSRNQIVNEFDLELFFETYESIFRTLPRYTSETIEGQYTSNWAEVSVRIRNSAKWTCECGVNCSENRGLLMLITSTVIGVITAGILKCLYGCHQQEPFHQRIGL